MAYRATVLLDNPDIGYHFEETSGTACSEDVVGGGTLDGTYNNSPLLNQAGGSADTETAVGFNGSETMTVASHALIENINQGDFTIEALMWFPAAGHTGSGFSIFASDGVNFTLNFVTDFGESAPELQLFATVDTATSNPTSESQDASFAAPAGEWVTIAMTYDQSAKLVRLYGNGIEVTYGAQLTGSGAEIAGSSGLTVGAQSFGAPEIIVDELYVWNSLLSQGQLLTHYLGISGSPPTTEINQETASFSDTVVDLLITQALDTIAFSDQVPMLQVITLVLDTMLASDEELSTAQAQGILLDNALIADVTKAIFPALIVEDLSVDDVLSTLRKAVTSIIDPVTITDSTSASLSTLIGLTSAFVMADLTREIDQLSDTFGLSETLEEKIAVYRALAESILLSDAISYEFLAVMSVEDSVTLADVLQNQVTATETVQDALEFVVFDQASGSVYSAWVMNTKNQGVTQYDNYNFNSAAKIGGSYYAASPTGLYLLGGDSDAGANISTAVKTGKTNFGVKAKTRVEDAYIGVAADGKLVIKTIADDGKERWYKAQNDNSEVDTQRFKLGRGVKSSFWQFELINQAGEDFELESIELRPVVLSRRI